jgi:hypothetical protein
MFLPNTDAVDTSYNICWSILLLRLLHFYVEREFGYLVSE